MSKFALRKLLDIMVQSMASDLYLSVGRPPAYRINGTIRLAGKNELTTEDTYALACEMLTDDQRQEFQKNKEFDTALDIEGLGRYRANLYRQRNNVGIVIRHIKTQIPTIDELKLPPILKEIILRKSGLILIAGATGHGKSTSMASLIDHRNSIETGHIISLEEPIEFVHEHKKSIITQREIGVDSHSFRAALRSALRQAPDVILIGEIREPKVMEVALSVAETGHLCLATIHASNTAQAIERIMNFFPAGRHRQIYLQLSLNLQAIMCQRLVPTIAEGRTAAIEIMLNEPGIRAIIQSGKLSNLRKVISDMMPVGGWTFDEHLFQLFSQKIISKEVALKNADSDNDLRLRMMLSEEQVDGRLKLAANRR